ncbi:MAG: hypothetical protein JXC33_07305 [Deltaproteobacteria bacterium]|nr:hypothetical protein [Deltaproteobacteria bacterium]
MYLLARYFLKKEGEQADLELEGLRDIYNNIQVVNSAVADIIRAATEADSSVNAIVILDMYAQAMPYIIGESLERIRNLFSPYVSISR